MKGSAPLSDTPSARAVEEDEDAEEENTDIGASGMTAAQLDELKATVDPLRFRDSKRYADRLNAASNRSAAT